MSYDERIVNVLYNTFWNQFDDNYLPLSFIYLAGVMLRYIYQERVFY